MSEGGREGERERERERKGERKKTWSEVSYGNTFGTLWASVHVKYPLIYFLLPMVPLQWQTLIQCSSVSSPVGS